jgi:hypothetical protein
MHSLYLSCAILFSIIGLCVGFLMLINPALAIEIQRRFYEKINWNIEPISVSIEIRNTRIMGGFIIIIVIAALFFVLTKPYFM